MLDRLFLSSGGGIEYIGSVTARYDSAGDWGNASPLDVLSIAQTGDLVVIAFSFDNDADDTWSWVGMSFAQILNATDSVGPGAYAGYRFVQAGDSNPYVSGASGSWEPLSVVASVFRYVNFFVNGSASSGSIGMPNPPSLTASGRIYVITGHIDDDLVTDWTAPANYTLAAYETSDPVLAPQISSTAIAYRIADLTTDNPAAFGGSGDDSWRASTSAYF